MRELAEFVPKLANSEEYLCSKFEEGLSLEIRKIYLFLVQLALVSKEKGISFHVWRIIKEESKL